MKLAKLLQQIESRKQHLVKVLPDFNTVTHYTIPTTFTLNRERFMFEFYLLQLNVVTPQNQSEEYAIEKAQRVVKNVLQRTYEVHVDIASTEIPSATQLKDNLIKSATRFL